jgi:hypothetical protein
MAVSCLTINVAVFWVNGAVSLIDPFLEGVSATAYINDFIVNCVAV